MQVRILALRPIIPKGDVVKTLALVWHWLGGKICVCLSGLATNIRVEKGMRTGR